VEITVDDVGRALHDLFIAAKGTALRKEDRKKAAEVAALLGEMGRIGRDPSVLDAAAGKAYVGFLSARFLGFRRVTVLEREARRVEICRRVAATFPDAIVDVRQGEVQDLDHWPEGLDAVVALHACGTASDAVIDGTVARRPRWLFLVPCCYSEALPLAARARERADEIGIPRQAEIRRSFLRTFVDAERTHRLEAAGYEVTLVPLVPPTVTPHNLLFRARWSGEERRMEAARARWERLVGRPMGGEPSGTPPIAGSAGGRSRAYS